MEGMKERGRALATTGAGLGQRALPWPISSFFFAHPTKRKRQHTELPKGFLLACFLG